MPKTTVFSLPGLDIVLGWSPAGEAQLTAVPVPTSDAVNLDNVEVADKFAPFKRIPTTRQRKGILSPRDVNDVIELMNRVKKQVFDTSPLEVLLKPAKMVSLIQSFKVSDAYSLLSRAIHLPCKYPVAVLGGLPHYHAQYIYFREKKSLSPNTMHYARRAIRGADGSFPDGVLEGLERGFVGELKDFNHRFDNGVEDALGLALFDSLHLFIDELMKDKPGHVPGQHVSVNLEGYVHPIAQIAWDGWITKDEIQSDIDMVFRVFENNREVAPPTHAYCDSPTLLRLFELWFGDTLEPKLIKAVPTDMFGLVWTPIDGLTGGAEKGKVAFVNWANNPLAIIDGPSPDYDAPVDYTGRFAKGWREQDPGATMILLEQSFAPVWVKPQQLVILNIA